MDFDEDDLALSQDSRGGQMRPTTAGGGQRPTTATRPTSRRGSAIGGPSGVRPFSRYNRTWI